jgi:adenine-specific DNA-methyltransferase
LRERFSTASGRIDLYGLFIERAVGLLPKGGVLAFIVPDKFLQSHTARPLRSLLLRNGCPRSIARFDSHKVFDDAATVPCVLVFERSGSADDFRAMDCEYNSSSGSAGVVVKRDEEVPTKRLAPESWRTGGNDVEAVAASIVGRHPRLAQLSARISAGLATGRDSIYVIDVFAAKGLERELLRTAVRGRDIGALSVGGSGLSILIPYTFTRNAPVLVDIRDYPRAHAYLKRFRDELEGRHCVRSWKKAWFDIHDPVSDDVARLQKVLVPDVAEAPRFIFDDGRLCPLHSAYYIVPKGIDGRFLAAILNSNPIEFLIRARAPVVKDGFNRYRRQFLVDLPIPEADADITEKVIEAAERRDFATIDEVAGSLFQLSRRHLKAITDHLSRLRYRRAAKDRARHVSA